MRFSLLSSVLALAASSTVVSAIPSTSVDYTLTTPSNTTLESRTLPSSQWYTDQCSSVSGTYSPFGFGLISFKYDFGCLCLSSLGDYCSHNGIESSLQSWIKDKITTATPKTTNYPNGCQPTCTTATKPYTCPQGTMNLDGTCSVASCGPGYCAQSDKTCCPNGTTKQNGVCSGNTTPSCGTGTLSNGQCCQSGWTGYSKCCCPAGQTEDPNNHGTCKCNDDSQTLDSTGKCVSQCGPNQSWYSSAGICCGSGATPIGGQCVCSAAGMTYSGSGKTGACVSKCQTTETWCSSGSYNKCCKSYMQLGSDGNCACPSLGWKDNGSQCYNPCSDQQYMSSTGQCMNHCSSGWWKPSGSSGMCCSSNTARPCQTICCETGYDESSGHCCKTGSVWNEKTWSCMAPSGAPKKKRTSFGLSQSVISASDKDLNIDNALCPSRMSACPISSLDPRGQYECLDAMTDETSCGGCTSIGKGMDCTAIKGARFTGCEAGVCQVYSCRKGFKQVNGTTCERE